MSHGWDLAHIITPWLLNDSDLIVPSRLYVSKDSRMQECRKVTTYVGMYVHACQNWLVFQLRLTVPDPAPNADSAGTAEVVSRASLGRSDRADGPALAQHTPDGAYDSLLEETIAHERLVLVVTLIILFHCNSEPGKLFYRSI